MILTIHIQNVGPISLMQKAFIITIPMVFMWIIPLDDNLYFLMPFLNALTFIMKSWSFVYLNLLFYDRFVLHLINHE